MHDKMNFQGETFPLEVLNSEVGEREAEFATEFETDELEDERGGGRYRQGFSARRRPAARYSRPGRRYPRPRPGGPGRPPWPLPPRPRWPNIAWPGGGAIPVPYPATDVGAAPPICTCGASAEPGAAPPALPAGDEPPPDTGAAGGDGADQELFGNIASRIGGFIGRATTMGEADIIDLTASADKTKRKGTRDPKTVYALVLHQMACCFAPRDPLKRFLTIGAHFAIANDGRILQLHPVSSLLWASNGFNARSVAVEFAGNFPSTRGKWWKGETYGKNRPTPAQVTAGRQLIRYLMRTMGLTTVLAHRQSSGTRENDPGPDVWFDVGQWAVNTLGLKDGGPGFKIGSGNSIPEEWRSWGSRRPAVTPEIASGFEQEMFETEIVHDVWDREHYEQSEQELLMHNKDCGCRRCAGAGAGAGSFESESVGYEAEGEFAGEFGQLSEEEEVELALELLSVSSEAELDQFLGKLMKGAWKGIKKVGAVVGKVAKPLGGVCVRWPRRPCRWWAAHSDRSFRFPVSARWSDPRSAMQSARPWKRKRAASAARIASWRSRAGSCKSRPTRRDRRPWHLRP